MAQQDPVVSTRQPLKVYYDGACPRCVRDRRRYTRLAGAASQGVEWVDITGREALLRARGIDPERALLELHVEDADGVLYSELDAYILLLGRVPRLRPLAWLLTLPGLKPLLGRLYRASVRRRLARQGRR